MSIASKLFFCLLSIIFLLFGGLLLADSLGRYQAAPALLTIAAIVPVFAVVGVLFLVLLVASAKIGTLYAPRGARIDPTHAWFEVISGKKVGPGTQRQVYEKYHGKGAWERMVSRSQNVINAIALVIACLGATWLLLKILDQAENPIIADFLSLVGSQAVAILVFVLSAAAACGFFLSYLYVLSAATPPLMELYTKYRPASAWKVIFCSLPALVVLIVAIFIQLYTWAPAFQAAISEQFFGSAVAVLYLALGLHWLAVAFPPRYQMTKEYRAEHSRRELLTFQFSLLQNADYPETLRMLAGIDLLRCDELSSEARQATIRLMEAISGKSYGGDVKKWEAYQRQL